MQKIRTYLLSKLFPKRKTIRLIPNYTIDKKSYNKQKRLKFSVSDIIKDLENLGCPALT